MGFLLQLRLLLWKNLSLKKRSPIVTTSELVIPLVLFFILIAIRFKKPSQPIHQAHFPAQPLPSAGIIPILQSFCPDGERDSYGFPTYPHSMVHQFLSKTSTVVMDNHLFNEDFTIDDIKILPNVFEDVINNQNSVEQKFATAKGFSLESILKNTTVFTQYLVHELSVPSESADDLLKYQINVKELYRVLYGVTPEKKDDSDQADSPTSMSLQRWLHRRLSGLKEGLLYQDLIDDHGVLDESELIGVLSQTGGLIDGLSTNSTQFVETLKNMLITEKVLQQLLCANDTEAQLLIAPDGQTNATDMIKEILCKSGSSVLANITQELLHDLDAEKIAKKLNLSTVDIVSSRKNTAALLKGLNKFATFEKNVRDISAFASLLPRDSCPGNENETDDSNEPFVFYNQSGYFFRNQSAYEYQHAEVNNTADPDIALEPDLDADLDDKTKKMVKLYKVWGNMQYVLCGINRTVDENALDGGDLKAAGFTWYQERNLQVIVHLLFNNPKILYAPNTTDVNDLIHKASDMLQFAQNITYFAHSWLNISDEIRDHLRRNTTGESYRWLRQMTFEFDEHRNILVNQSVHNDLNDYIVNGSKPDITLMKEKLDIIDNAACAWIELVSKSNSNVFKPFPNESALVEYTLNKALSENVTVFASLVFKVDEHGKLPPHVIYKIRQNSSFTDNTNLVREKYWTPGPNHARSVRYYQFAFVLIQDIIERAIIDKRVNRTVVEPGSYVQEFPYPCYIQDRFLFVIEHMFPIVMIISWVYYVAMLTQSIVYEKEQRLKEVMKMMGLSNAVHWVAWFITSFLEMSITIISLVCILKYGKVLTYSNPVIIWMFLSIFAIATIMFCFMVSSLFSKAKLAAACAGILYFISYVPYLYIALREEVVGEAIPFVSKSFASMLSTSAFGIGAKYFALYEEEGVGLQWSNLGRSPLEQDQFNLLHIMLIMIGDASLYFVVTWYVEAVHPGSYGLPRPWYFPFQKSYWFGHGSTESTQISFTSCFQFKRNNYNSLSVMEEDQACAMATASQDEDSKMEEEPVHLPLGVCIDKLVKVYKTGKLAVNKLSLNLYEGQITSFLGHNGAGKTTSMSILTGLIPPTSGTAVIYGHDIKTDMLQIRQSLGMCPQHNALFEKLTVEEHIWFYAKLKGTSSSDIDKEKNGLIKDIGLYHKKHHNVETLSGGMQRKLSVAIAFVGGSRTVILDEPTAGVDPYARRAIWDLLMKYKHGRTILLSTHHMDEADLLGDRIAIIANGQLKCCGSSLFLKSNYGNGYKLTIVKKPTDYTSADNTSMENLIELDDSSDVDDDNSQSRRPDVSSLTSYNSCTESVVTEFIQKDIPSATLTAENHHELSYVLPSEAAKKGTFEKLFDNLNDHIGELCISSYGLTDTSLEEVFMKVTQGSNSISDEDAMDKETFSLLSNSMATSPQNCIAVNSSRAQGTPETLGRSVRLCQSVRYSPPNASSLSTSDLSLSPVHPVNVEMCENVVEPTDDTGDVTLDEVYQRQLGEVEPLLNFGESLSQDIVNESNSDNSSGDSRSNQCLEGAGSYKLTGFSLTITQFVGLLLKRFHHSKRNWKGLFSQLLLPALFICIAMTVALLAPQVGDLPPLVLSPSQYHQLEHPEGNYIPYNNEAKYGSHYTVYKSPDGDAGPAKLASTLEISVGATCVLADTNKTNYYSVLKANSTLYFDKVLSDYDSMCLKSFYHHGILSSDYVSLSSRPAPVVHPLGPSPEDNIYEVDYMDYNTNNNETIQITEIACQCANDGHGFICPVEVGEPEPPTHRVITADIMLDVSGRNVSEYFLYTSDKYKLHRYGALSFGNVRPFVPPDFGGVVPVIYRKLAVRNSAVAWHNHKGFHSMPTYLNALNNAILRANLDPAVHGNPSAYGITVINHPMNKTSTRLSTEYMLQGTDVVIAIFIIVALSFVPASFVVFLVSERATKAKHLQFVSGVNPVVYWASNYTWDILNYLVPAACCISILLLFDVPAYTSSTNLPAVILLFLLYGWSITPMMYTASFYFDVPSTAYVFLIVINLFTGITTVVAAFFLELFSDDKDLKQIGTTLNAIFLMFPNYCLGRGLMDVAYNDYFNEYYYRIGAFDKMHTPFEWQLTSRMLVVMAIEGLVFFVLTLLIEYRFFIKPRKLLLSRQSLPDEDEDVAKERQRVMRGDADNDLLKLHNLTKVYKTRRSGRHLAVDRVCLGVPQGECFGLLGVNGAGKTTTFKMLTGDELITRGEAFLNGHNIATEIHSVHQNIGYCPQFDALFDELTAKEHLMLYARLRGIPHHEQKQVVDWALRKLALLQYADKPAGTFSGGNKRKLSTAIALLGHPPVIFMDEPTTGMDPHSRRFLWDLILNIIKGGRSVILTSHSMEECEALCTRLAIMVNGHFKCLGSIQHLKNRFGDGYTITIRVKGGSRPNLQPVVRYFARNFPSAILKEKHHNMVQYDLKSEDNVSLATIFSQMKVMEDLLNIEDYSVSQTTLDNVFINFAKLQCEGGADDSPVITRRVPTELQDLLNEEYLQDEDSEDFTVRFDERESHLAFNMEIV